MKPGYNSSKFSIARLLLGRFLICGNPHEHQPLLLGLTSHVIVHHGTMWSCYVTSQILIGCCIFHKVVPPR